MMSKKISLLLTAMLFSLCVVAVVLWQVPYLLMAKSSQSVLDQVSGPNRFHFQALSKEGDTWIPSPNPDLLYSSLVFDLSQSALRVELPRHEQFWIAQFVGENTDSFAYTGYRDAAFQNDQSATQAVMLFYGERPNIDVDNSLKWIEAPSKTGLILVRHLVKDKRELAALDQLRRRSKAQEIAAEL